VQIAQPTMAGFLENLWTSVFTPGPTPTLLIAANATFGALQLLLGALFLVTYSIHFAILSVLCAGLWYSVNWFANELQQAQAKEAEAERLRKQKKSTTRAEEHWRAKGEVGDSADDEGEDTETEGVGMRESVGGASEAGGENEATEEEMRVRGEIVDASKASGQAGTGGASSGSQAAGGSSAPIQRRVSDRSGEVSTDSEWEKVEGGR